MIDAGYVIYDPLSPIEKYYFDKTTGSGMGDVSTSNENNRQELRTFGRVPYVYYAGETDYVTFELSTVFIPNEGTGESSREQADKFIALIKTRKTLLVENSQGKSFKCDVNITGESSPNLYVEGDMDYVEIKVKCTQIDI